jgi:hypothetical protein
MPVIPFPVPAAFYPVARYPVVPSSWRDPMPAYPNIFAPSPAPMPGNPDEMTPRLSRHYFLPHGRRGDPGTGLKQTSNHVDEQHRHNGQEKHFSFHLHLHIRITMHSIQLDNNQRNTDFIVRQTPITVTFALGIPGIFPDPAAGIGKTDKNSMPSRVQKRDTEPF